MYARAHSQGPYSHSLAVASSIGSSARAFSTRPSEASSNEIIILKQQDNGLPQTSRHRGTVITIGNAGVSTISSGSAFISEFTYPGEVYEKPSTNNMTTRMTSTVASSNIRPSAPGTVEDEHYVTHIEIPAIPTQAQSQNAIKQQRSNFSSIERDPRSTSNHSVTSKKPSLQQNMTISSKVDPKELAYTYKLDDQTLKQYQEAFRIFDRNNDGCITCQELGTVMRSLGIQPSDEELQNMVDEVDVDGSGTIEFDEFVQMMAKRLAEKGELDGEEELKGAFEVFDRNRDGYITAEELRMVMRSLGENLTDQELNEMMKAADANGDGIINFNEFQEVWLEAQHLASK